MLSKEDNDLFNLIEPGNPGHTYFKHFWMPVIRSEMVEAGGIPHKVEVLGEKYVVFRDTSGNVGFLEEGCPHRGISLTLGRNENDALTCIFHGWSFNAKGECIATPTEPNKDFCKKVRVRAYPVREAGGAVWVYLAPGEPARFPDLPFVYAKPGTTYCRKAMMRANWSQTTEQGLDTAHVSFLHSNAIRSENAPQSIKDAAGQTPYYHITTQPYGYRNFSRRDRPDGTTSIRVGEFIFPNMAMISSTEDEVAFMTVVTPINNTNCMFWTFMWGTAEQIAQGGLVKTPGDPNDWAGDLLDRSKPNMGQDREAMKKGDWSGYKYLAVEDIAVSESMPILDRTKEFLGSVDTAIIRYRRDYLKELRAIRDGNWQGRGDLSGINYRGLRAHALVLPIKEDMVAYIEALNSRRMEAIEKAAIAAE